MSTDTDMPGFLIADHGPRQFAIHTREPRFIAEVSPSDGDPDGVAFRFHFHDPAVPPPTGEALAQVTRATRVFYAGALHRKRQQQLN